ncbi:fungal protein [Schizosaccharomyces cryophilus OY26]|uniref:Fungal protein n=1 Tax=Schizosaccharomyces cryophilus (strain OY26 / ATCC MYA-4695 / CBS 11777 / NBRC 106824 / NRRL Y48691) TaxID=653667 RepID=S9X8H7_SCHCR|nr:uncharacterized protein SPOG_04560 [Schizosaccharomyces cryophilus OY26]EPY53437.1 fungal protein [Schizosaccharomyces cryophilus OY26]
MSDHSAPPPSYDEVMREEAQLLSQGNTGAQYSHQNHSRPSSSPPLPSRPSHSPNVSQSSFRPHNRPSYPSSSSYQGSSSTGGYTVPDYGPPRFGKRPHSTSHNYPSHSSSPAPQSAPMNRPYPYPPGYHCYRCDNTGYKPGGRPCGRCARRFGHSFDVQYMSYGRPPPNALVVQPGDPRIPGHLCGNCKGTGQVDFLIFTELCSVCNGIGKIP